MDFICRQCDINLLDFLVQIESNSLKLLIETRHHTNDFAVFSILLFYQSSHNLLGSFDFAHQAGYFFRKSLFGITYPTRALRAKNSLFLGMGFQKLLVNKFMGYFDALSLKEDTFNGWVKIPKKLGNFLIELFRFH